jgi:hypothetical protein
MPEYQPQIRKDRPSASEMLNPQSDYNKAFERGIDQFLRSIPTVTGKIDELFRELEHPLDTPAKRIALESRLIKLLFHNTLSEEDLNNILIQHLNKFHQFNESFVQEILAFSKVRHNVREKIEDIVFQALAQDEVLNELEPQH